LLCALSNGVINDSAVCFWAIFYQSVISAVEPYIKQGCMTKVINDPHRLIFGFYEQWRFYVWGQGAQAS